MALFLDIWSIRISLGISRWLDILKVLRDWKCLNNLYRLIMYYSIRRSVTLRVENSKVSKCVTRGWPQGSVVGYQLWNILFIMFLNLPHEDEISVESHADDGLL